MKDRKSIMSVMLSFCLVAGMTATPEATMEAAKATKGAEKTSVKVAAPYTKKAYIAKGKSVKFSANQKVTYKSKNKKVATVTSKGIVKGKKVGTAKIVVASKNNKKKKTSITVRVMKQAVKKVALNKKNVSLQAGERITLKAKVTAKKGASKRVYWKTSNASVATVSQKGVVTAKKEGTATITVQAADGSKKKATCKVQVTASSTDVPARPTPLPSDDIIGVTVMNSWGLNFTLARPHTLKESDVVIQRRAMSYGEYKSKLAIDTLYSADGQNYTVILPEDSEIEQGEFVKVTVSGLEGLKEWEVQYFEPTGVYKKEYVYTGTVGKQVTWSSRFSDGVGYSEYNVTGLPEGFTYENRHGTLYVEGTPTTVGISEAQVEAMDERGNTYNEKMILCIGSETQLAAYASEIVGYAVDGTSGAVSRTVRVVGGSGEYTYAMVSADSGFQVNSYGSVSGSLREAGYYRANVLVTDVNNPALTTTVNVPFRIEQGVKVTGTVTDAVGNSITDRAEVYFSKSDVTDPNPMGVYTYCDEDGKYSATMPKGKFNIRVKNGQKKASIGFFDREITESQTMDFALPLYRVTILTPEGDEFGGHVGWKDNDGKLLGWGSKIYLRPGQYDMVSVEQPYHKAKFTVGSEAIQVVAPVEE